MRVRSCAQCRYDLRDFDDRIECPQCGYPIAESRKAREAAWGKVAWIPATIIGVIVVTVPVIMYRAREHWWPTPQVIPPQTVRADADVLIRKVREWMGDWGRTSLPAGFTLKDLVSDNYVRPEDIVDPWGNAYMIDTEQMRVLSYGSDGVPGGMGEAADIISAPLP